MTTRSAWIKRLGAPSPIERIEVGEDREVILGRAAACDVVLTGRGVSKRHAALALRGGVLWVRDLESRNGTFLLSRETRSERRVRSAAPLSEGESVLVAGYEIVPAKPLSGSVGLVDGSLGTGETWLSLADSDPSAKLGAEGAAQEAMRALASGGAATGEAQGALKRLLRGIALLADARDGVLLAWEGERFVLCAHLDEHRPCTISETFLHETLRAGGVSYLDFAARSRTASTGDSRADFEPGSIVLGVPLLAKGSLPVGVASLELAVVPSPERVAALEAAAPTAATLLALWRRLDGEKRARAAAERRATGAVVGRDSEDSRVVLEESLVGKNPAFLTALADARQAAGSGASVLVRGPSGCGKELVAQLVHLASPRAEHAFVSRNCASIPDELVESELFGHDAGAFTGADSARVGAFHRADGGTLFLDEVGDLSKGAQASLLRALESGEVVRVGGSLERVDVRVVAATHRDLEAMIEAGTFREDLYFRLRVIEVMLPALADRPEDILPLAEFFLERLGGELGVGKPGLTPAAARCLTRYAWPGNVRELRNVIERALVLGGGGALDVSDLPAELRPAGRTPDGCEGLEAYLELEWREAKRAFSSAFFSAALASHGGRVGETAKAVGVSRRTLSHLIRELGLREQ